jgi:glycosyltransferase involved in cell wall biosynthesis
MVALPFRFLGVRYIFDYHDVNPELYFSKYGRKDFFYKVQLWLEKFTFRCSTVVMATNYSYKEIAVRRGGKDPEDVFVVRNGPDLATFTLASPNPALKYGKRYLVGYVGTMSVQEGLDILIDAAEYVGKMGRDDVHFTCVGGGTELLSLRKMISERRLDGMFNFTGRISDASLLEVLSTADVCVNPDRPCEMNDLSTMIKIMEYMALGKPIVQFDLKEGKFSAQEASLYSDTQNCVADFADKILWLLDHAEERQRMGEFGRQRVEKELAWEHSIGNLLAAYNRVFSKMRGKRALRSDIAEA